MKADVTLVTLCNNSFFTLIIWMFTSIFYRKSYSTCLKTSFLVIMDVIPFDFRWKYQMLQFPVVGQLLAKVLLFYYTSKQWLNYVSLKNFGRSFACLLVCLFSYINLKHSKTILFPIWLKESHKPGLRLDYSAFSLEQIFLKDLGEGCWRGWREKK